MGQSDVNTSGFGTDRGRGTLAATFACFGCRSNDSPHTRALVENKVIGRRSNDENFEDVGLGVFEIADCSHPGDTTVVFNFKDIKRI
jgi:hypothetical protein